MAIINGFLSRHTVSDLPGSTRNRVGGLANTVDFRGDHGANDFGVGGVANNVRVFNLGRDDSVQLEGPGWAQLPDADASDGAVSYFNRITGSYAEIHTDGGRNDDFVRARVALDPNRTAGCQDWSRLGRASSMSGSQSPFEAFFEGVAMGQEIGQRLFGGGWASLFRARW